MVTAVTVVMVTAVIMIVITKAFVIITIGIEVVVRVGHRNHNHSPKGRQPRPMLSTGKEDATTAGVYVHNGTRCRHYFLVKTH